MNESIRNTLVGSFVLAGLAVLGTLMVWFGEVPDWLARGEWSLHVVQVRNLKGVGDGNPVALNGVTIGRVVGIDFLDPNQPDQGVVINTRIKQRFSVPHGATALVYGASFGFGGGQVVIVVEPGLQQAPLPKDGTAFIVGEMRSMVGELISREMIDSVQQTITNIGNLAESATPVMNSLNNLMERRTMVEVDRPGSEGERAIANLSTVVERFDELLANVDAVLGDERVQEDVKQGVRNLKESVTLLGETIRSWKTDSERIAANLDRGISRTTEHLDDAFVQLIATLDNLDNASRSLATVLAGVEAGQGTAGRIARDDRLYEAAVVALERFGDVMSDLRVITGKIKNDGYITVGQAPSGLFRKKIPLGSPVPTR